MKLLRDVREGTRLLLLLEISTGRHTRLKSLAKKLDLSVQGVSGYLAALTEEGLVQREDGVYAPTMAGVEALHDRLRELREFVEQSYAETRILDTTTAIAGEPIRAGDEVGLFMDGGRLVAYPKRDSSSRGRSLQSVARGEDVAVVDLEGMVDLEPGTITVFRVPGAARGGTADVDLEEARRLVSSVENGAVGVSDVVALVLAEKLEITTDFEFAAVAAAHEAAQRGINVLLLASQDSSSDVVKGLEAANEGTEKPVTYRVVDLPRRGGG
ncbi:MAG: hypothetical protein ACE5KQ_00505 [Thermoplasmata archaeon]